MFIGYVEATSMGTKSTMIEGIKPCRDLKKKKRQNKAQKLTYFSWKLTLDFTKEIVHFFSAVLINGSADGPDQREQEPQFNHAGIAVLMRMNLIQ